MGSIGSSDAYVSKYAVSELMQWYRIASHLSPCAHQPRTRMSPPAASGTQHAARNTQHQPRFQGPRSGLVRYLPRCRRKTADTPPRRASSHRRDGPPAHWLRGHWRNLAYRHLRWPLGPGPWVPFGTMHVNADVGYATGQQRRERSRPGTVGRDLSLSLSLRRDGSSMAVAVAAKVRSWTCTAADRASRGPCVRCHRYRRRPRAQVSLRWRWQWR